MLKFLTFKGEAIPIQAEEGIQEERMLIAQLDRQYRTADHGDPRQMHVVQKNMNTAIKLMGLKKVPEDGTPNEGTIAMVKYFEKYKDLFLEHGIKDHFKARELHKVLEKVEEPHEYAPTIEEMKMLDVNLGDLNAEKLGQE